MVRMKRGVRDEIMLRDYSKMKPIYDLLEDPNVDLNTKLNHFAEVGLVWNSTNNPAAPAFDMESDIFTYSAGALNGKFFMDFQGNAHSMPASRNKIMHGDIMLLNNRYNFFMRFTVVDTDGITYVFDKSQDNTRAAYESIRSNSDCSESDDTSLEVNTWYITDIILPNGKTITFSYVPFSYCAGGYTSDGLALVKSSV